MIPMKTKLKFFFPSSLPGLAALSLCLAPSAWALDGQPLWTNRFNGNANGDDYAASLAMDGNGNVYVTGYSSGAASGFDYTTIKYSSAGAPSWTNQYNGPLN